MNKRQGKKNKRRELERLEAYLEDAQKDLVHFWCTSQPQNERERGNIQYNLHNFNYLNEQERQEKLEKKRMQAKGKAWKHRSKHHD